MSCSMTKTFVQTIKLCNCPYETSQLILLWENRAKVLMTHLRCTVGTYPNLIQISVMLPGMTLRLNQPLTV